MSRADFAAALRELDERLAAPGMPPSADRRVRERLRLAELARRRLARRMRAVPRRSSGARKWLAIPALACVAVLALGILVGLRGRSGDAMSFAPTEVAGFVLVAGSPDLDLASIDGALELRRGSCTLRQPNAAMTLDVAGAAKVRRERDGVRVERGTVAFTADPSGDERVVAVSHGEIRITGTRFTVVQTAEGGSVALHEGGIRFEVAGREPTTVRPGETVAWPLPVVAPEEPAAVVGEAAPAGSGARPGPGLGPAAAPGRGSGSGTGTGSGSGAGGDLLARIEALRSQGRYAEAAELAASAPSSSASRERLSYERGGLLTYQLRDRDRACAHWQRHAAEFPAGGYAVEVQRARAHLGCR
jgi:transmembrane sensor